MDATIRRPALAPVPDAPEPRGPHRARLGVPAIFRAPSPDGLALAAITLFLAGFGLVMVLSASSVEQGQSGDPFADFAKQGVAELLGVGAMLALSRAHRSWLLTAAPFVFGAAVVLQLLTALTPLGVKVNGNRNWIHVAGFSLQPSEFVKLGTVLVLGAFFSRRPGETLRFRELAPIGIVAITGVGSVLAGKDLGTSLVLGLIVLGGLVFAGVRVRVVTPVLLLGAIAFAGFAIERPSRLERLTAWGSGCGNDVLDTCWQSTQATWALANGGLTGVGIGGSVSKWFWLPEADNDFILAIIGEETGLIGLAVLLALFVALAVVLLRTVTRSGDRFLRALAGMILTWLVGQAFANIAVVLGFLPVFGVPLPFVSSGGSSMIANLLAVGCVLALLSAAPAASAPVVAPPRLAAVPRP